MPRDVDVRMILLGIEAHAAVSELVLQGGDRQFVAGDHTRRENAVVAQTQLYERVGALGRPRQGRPVLALAAGAQIQDLVRRPDPRLFFREDALAVVEQADVARSGRDPVHRPARRGDAAPGQLGGLDDADHAGDVRGEAADRDPAGLQAADQLDQTGLGVQLGPRLALDEDIGRIADHRQQAFVAQLGNRCDVCGLADDRAGVQLPVAGVEDRAQRRLDRQRIRLGD